MSTHDLIFDAIANATEIYAEDRGAIFRVVFKIELPEPALERVADEANRSRRSRASVVRKAV